MYHFGRGEVVCPVCMSQKEVGREELEQARKFRAAAGEVNQTAAELVRRRALAPGEMGRPAGMSRHALEKNPNRRAVYRMLGIYLPEREAKALLRNVHHYKWIEAEKAGYDVWEKRGERCALTAAAREWAARYLAQFLALCQRPDWTGRAVVSPV